MEWEGNERTHEEEVGCGEVTCAHSGDRAHRTTRGGIGMRKSDEGRSGSCAQQGLASAQPAHHQRLGLDRILLKQVLGEFAGGLDQLGIALELSVAQ